MKTIIISYSLSGNNENLAKSLVKALAAEHIRITEAKPRTMGKIIFDMLFNRTPKIQMPEVKPEQANLVLFVGPVWMGKVASPFRACFKRIASKVATYAFVSISGGALGPNPKLAAELKTRLGKEPVTVIDLHIADLLPSEPKPTLKDTSAYQVNEKDIKYLTGKVGDALKETTAKLN